MGLGGKGGNLNALEPAEQFKPEQEQPKPSLPALRAIPQPWEQQIGEKPERFRFFAAYRDMNPRRYTALAKLVGLSVHTIKAYASEGQWASRAEAWDRELDRRIREMQTEEIVEMRRRHIDTSLKMQEAAELEITAHLRKIRDAIKKAQEGVRAQAQLAGWTEEQTQEALAEAYHEPLFNMRDLISLLDHGTKLERLNRGEPTDHTATSTDQAKAEAERTKAMLDNLSVNEKKAFMKLKMRAAGMDIPEESDRGAYKPGDPAAQPLDGRHTALAPDPEPEGLDPEPDE